MANITFIITPANGGTIRANGNVVSAGVPIQFEIGSTVNLNAEPMDGFEFLNWNEGESFDADWQFEVVGDATIKADFSSL